MKRVGMGVESKESLEQEVVKLRKENEELKKKLSAKGKKGKTEEPDEEPVERVAE